MRSNKMFCIINNNLDNKLLVLVVNYYLNSTNINNTTNNTIFLNSIISNLM